jgi:hypothetical protein
MEQLAVQRASIPTQLPIMSAQWDVWTSVKLTPYGGLVVMYITDDFELRSVNLSMTNLSDGHDADHVVAWVNEVCHSWLACGEDVAIAEILVAATTDGAGGLKASNGLNVPWIWCYAHRLSVAMGWSMGVRGKISLNTKGLEILKQLRAVCGPAMLCILRLSVSDEYDMNIK